MTVILVIAMFVTFFVVESFTRRPATEREQTAVAAASEVAASQSIVEAEGHEQPRLRHVRTGTDRRRAERRGGRGQSAA